MVNVILSSFIVALISAAVLWLVVVAIVTFTSLRWQEILSYRLFTEFYEMLKISFDVKAAVAIVGLLTLLFSIPVYDAYSQKSHANSLECRCSCKDCKETARTIDAIAKHLGLDSKMSSETKQKQD